MISWIASAFELVGKWMVGNKNRYGFVMSFICCLLWIIVAIQAPKARGLLLVALPASVINIRNFLKWRADDGRT